MSTPDEPKPDGPKPDGPPSGKQELGKQALKGAKWAVGARLIRTLIGIGTLSILSRLISPAEFGILALIMFVAALAQVFTDFGTRVALVQRPEVTQIEQDSVFWSNMLLSGVVVTGIWIFAPQISVLLGSPGMAEPLRWVLPVFVFGGLHGVSLSVLERRFAFNRIATTELTAAVSGAAVAVALAYSGRTIEALVAQQVTNALVHAGMTIAFARWRPRLRFSFGALKPLLSYGSYITASGLVFFVAQRADRPIVGNRLDAADLGYLAMAQQIVQAPIKITVQMVRRVMFPIMASIQTDNVRMRRGYLTVQHALLVVMAPMALGLWSIADPVVAVVLGPDWALVATLMGYMTLRSIFATFNDFNSVIYSAKGWARFQFRWSIFSAAANIGVLLAAVQYGIEAVVAARLALTVALTPLNSYWVLKLIDQGYGELLSVALRPLVSGVVMAAALVALQQVLPPAPIVRILACIPAGALVYGAMEMLIDRPRVMALLDQIRDRKKKAA